jgi:glutamyl-tRNA reductase
MAKRTYQSDIQRYLNLKNGSLARGNALGYFKAINYLGIPEEQIEDIDLYRLGEMEYHKKLQEKEKSKKINSLEKSLISDIDEFDESSKRDKDLKFYQWGHEIYQREDTRATDEKRRLLAEYYPYRFGNRGKTPSYDLSHKTINKIFDSIIKRIKDTYNF